MNEPSFAKALFYGALPESSIFPFDPPVATETLVPTLESWRKFFDKQPLDSEAWLRDRESWLGMGRLGVLGMGTSAALGGAGWSASAQARAFQELMNIDASLAYAVLSHVALASYTLATFGQRGTVDPIMRDLATGASIGAFALAEPGAGSDAGQLQTRADLRADGRYVITGTKGWVANAPMADAVALFARTSPADDAHKPRITAFLVNRVDGFSTTETPAKIGVQSLPTGFVHLAQVAVERSARLGEEGRGFRVAMEVLTRARLSFAGACVGLCKRVIRATIERANSRRAFARAIGDFGLIKDKVATMLASTFALESMVYTTTQAIDRGDADFSVESAMCKVFASETTWHIAHEAMNIAAGAGFSTEAPFEKALRDARFGLLFQGTNETLRCFIALSGMQGPGREIEEVSRAMREPIKGFGLLGDFAWRKARSALGRERLTHHHPLLSREALLLDEHAQCLARNVEKVLRRHGHQIAEMQFSQKRIADVAIDLYAIACAISRTTALLNARGENGARRAIDFTHVFVNAAEQRLAQNETGFDHNDDELRKAIGARAYADGSYPLDIL
jgi:acyl-CoA dehydrogenase family protein 9